MNPDVEFYNASLEVAEEREICLVLATAINRQLVEAEHKIWHRHPVWFLDGNPTVGYDKIKAGIRLMFWSGASFEEDELKLGTGKFKDASILYTDVSQIRKSDLRRWLKKSTEIQWDYKNVAKRKGKLVRLK